ncbi:MAG: hypothetical protein BroJett040_22080 [Oligoflexia bacterium]|nr:MAG: hypothetical protein BroJett040_22080 [Oligoflexia bacterium]
MNKKSFIALSSMVVLAILSGCGQKKDVDKIAEAQSCLDASTAATAVACMEKVDGLSTEASYLIRCSAMFVQEGFSNPTKLAQAVNNMRGTGASSSASVMSVLAFSYAGTDQTTNYANATAASNYCSLSGSKGLIMLATISKLASAANYVNSANCGGAGDMTAALTCLKNNSTAVSSDLGTVMITTYQASCATVNDSNKLFCDQFSTAITNAGGTSNPSAVANAFLNQF